MKRVSADDAAIVFQLSNRERAALVQILESYPVLPPAHRRLSKEMKEPRLADYQRLLDEALAEQRDANQRQLHAWLAEPARFQKSKTGCRMTMERADSEWLLQVLNDIRVGNWLRLGSPELGELNPRSLSPKLLPIWLMMEMSGYFQMSIMEALDR